jgi:hypothetical protein
MTTAWVLNALGLFVTTVGALLTFLYLHKIPRFTENFASPDVRRDFTRQQRSLKWVVGLLASWLVLQCLALILL